MIMKILQVNCVYGKGSTGKIVEGIHQGLLERGIASVVCYGRGCRVDKPNIYKVCGEIYSKLNNALSRLTGLMYGGCFFSTNRLIRRIKQEKPDVVHLHCINGYFVNIYRLITFLKGSGIPTVLTLHAEFMHTANCGHALDCEKWKTGCGKCPRRKKETKSLFIDGTARSWRKMKAAFEGFDNLEVVSVSPWLMARAKQSPILADKKHSVVYNGVDTRIFKPYDTADLRKTLGIEENEKVVFHATPNFNLDPDGLKGGYYIAKLAEQMPDVRFVVAGPYDPSCVYPPNMLLLGHISDQTYLARLYSMADVTVIASKRETFSMICAESLCCGTPVAGFKAGAPEMISLPEHSAFVEYGDLFGLEDLVRNVLKKAKETDQVREESLVAYSKKQMVNRYIDVYIKLMDKIKI